MMKNRILKEKLKKNELTIGSWITIGHPAIPEILATAGFDWLTIDVEHNLIDPAMVSSLIRAVQANDIAALVRVSKNDEVIIKHVMDAGADGVIVPMVNSKADAIKAVEFVKYPPIGKRGVGLSRAQKYGTAFDEYKVWLENFAVVIAQIEHIDAINNIEEIIKTPGIDGVIIGPYDLSASLGYPGDYNRTEVKSAIGFMEEVCVKNNFPMGYHVVPPKANLVNERVAQGYRFIAFSTDFLFLGDTARILMNEVK
jgi:2-dehydro-3-deoxyglucarate aldolase